MHVLTRYQGAQFVLGILVTQLYTTNKTLKENKGVKKDSYPFYRDFRSLRTNLVHKKPWNKGYLAYESLVRKLSYESNNLRKTRG